MNPSEVMVWWAWKGTELAAILGIHRDVAFTLGGGFFLMRAEPGGQASGTCP